MGQLIGGVLGVFILAAIVEWLVFRHVMDDPVKGKIVSAVTAYVLASVVFGFGEANGGPWRPDGFIVYLLGLLVVGAYGIYRGQKIRDQHNIADDFS